MPTKDSGMSPEGMDAAKKAVEHLRECIESGQHWYIGLLEAIGLWTAPEEVYKGRQYHYVIAGEAFDWLALAERLCDSVDGLVPQNEEEALLQRSEVPIDLATGEFKRLVGGSKYSALLNYWYGVDVECALVKAVEEAIQKERVAAGLTRKRHVSQEAYSRIYGSSQRELLGAFLKEKGYDGGGALQAPERKEFTYWLFNQRLLNHDKARVASDTRRGLEQLRSTVSRRPNGGRLPPHQAPMDTGDGGVPTQGRRPGVRV
ncbi:MAG: hypothetical protein IIB11_06915 [Chloroflexi bacterium]|nr:hypothetical protein [Chloroflexota bacterium]